MPEEGVDLESHDIASAGSSTAVLEPQRTEGAEAEKAPLPKWVENTLQRTTDIFTRDLPQEAIDQEIAAKREEKGDENATLDEGDIYVLRYFEALKVLNTDLRREPERVPVALELMRQKRIPKGPAKVPFETKAADIQRDRAKRAAEKAAREAKAAQNISLELGTTSGNPNGITLAENVSQFSPVIDDEDQITPFDKVTADGGVKLDEDASSASTTPIGEVSDDTTTHGGVTVDRGEGIGTAGESADSGSSPVHPTVSEPTTDRSFDDTLSLASRAAIDGSTTALGQRSNESAAVPTPRDTSSQAENFLLSTSPAPEPFLTSENNLSEDEAVSPRVASLAEKLREKVKEKYKENRGRVARAVAVGMIAFMGFHEDAKAPGVENIPTPSPKPPLPLVSPDYAPPYSPEPRIPETPKESDTEAPSYIVGSGIVPEPTAPTLEAPASLPMPEPPPLSAMPQAPELTSPPVPEISASGEARNTLPGEAPGPVVSEASPQEQFLETITHLGKRETLPPGSNYSRALIDSSNGTVDIDIVKNNILNVAENLVTTVLLNRDAIINSQRIGKNTEVTEEQLLALSGQALDANSPEYQVAMQGLEEYLNYIIAEPVQNVTLVTPADLSEISPEVVKAVKENNVENLHLIVDRVGTEPTLENQAGTNDTVS